MRERFLKNITEKHLLAHGEQAVVGVSGGADSVCLLLLLYSVREELSLGLTVCHVQHGIRGEAAEGDAVFVEELAGRLGLPFIRKNVDVPGYSRKTGLGTEEAARVLRYRAFSEALKETGSSTLVVAHNLSDQAETVLFRLARGTGVRGAGGMEEMTESTAAGVHFKLVRPLLAFSREEIEAFLGENGERFRVDETNLETEYGRNRIRHRVLPELAELNSQAVRHIAAFSEEMRKLSCYWDTMSDILLRKAAAEPEGPGRMPPAYRISVLREAPELLRREALHRVLSLWSGGEKDLTRKHVEAACGLLAGSSGRSLTLPGGLTVRREQGLLTAARGEESRGEAFYVPVPFPPEAGNRSPVPENVDGKTEDSCTEAGSGFPESLGGGRENMPENFTAVLPDGSRLTLSVRVRAPGEAVPPEPGKNSCTKCFDYDKIGCGLCIRTRQPGDYFVIHPEGGRKLVQDYFVDRKVPAPEREKAVLLCEGSCVLWAPHFRTSENRRITENTKRVLVCTLEERLS